MFYIICASADLYYKNQDCFTVIENGSNETGMIVLNFIFSILPNPTENLRDMINQAMPIRFVRMHAIFCPVNTNIFSLERYIIPSFLALNAPILRGINANVYLHYCLSPNEAAPLLRQHRIPETCIPDVLGGSWSYDEFEDWFVQASLQVDPILDSSKTKPEGIQSTLTKESFLFESELCSYQNNSPFFGKIEIPPNIVDDLSQNSNYCDDEDMDDFIDFDEYFDDVDIMSEASSSVVPLDNCSGAEAIKIATEPNNDRSLQVQEFDSPYERGNDRVESECDSSSSPNRIGSRNQQARWSEKFTEICKYREKMGHCLVPQTYKENIALGAWVKRQRYQYKLMIKEKPSNLTVDRLQALYDIGFVWDSQDVAWGNQLYELQLFKDEFKHCNIPSNYSQNPRLAAWVKRQRRQYELYCKNKQSSLTPERFRQLQGLNFEEDGLFKKS